MIRIKRVYEAAAKNDGRRFLVERLWPRGIKKDELPMAGWIKEAAPSQALRQWFGHDPEKWAEFQRRYRTELKASPDHWEALLDAARKGPVTLLYSSRDTEHNSAALLRAFMEEQLAHLKT